MASIYQQVLGKRFGDLQPELQDYFSLDPSAGTYGQGIGVFDVAGCPARFARPAFRIAAREHAFFPDYGTDIPFTIHNYAHTDPFGRSSLTAVRELRFDSAVRVFEDTTSLTGGTLIDYIGKHRRMATALECSVTANGHLRMVSSRFRVYAGLRIPIPDSLGALAYMEQRWDDGAAAFKIQTKVVHRQLGTLLVYAGHFNYTLITRAERPVDPGPSAAASSLPAHAQPQRWEERN